jgi:hypothetical protein
MSKAIQIVVTSSRGRTLRGALDYRSNLTFNLPRPVVADITAQVTAGQDRGHVTHDGQGFAWFSADIFQVRQDADGTWYVFDTVEQLKTHDGYFPACKGAEAELEAIFAEAVQGSGRSGRNTLVA